MIRILILIAIVMSPAILIGASFDCTKSSNDVEKTICENVELSTLDEELSLIYSILINKLSEKERNALITNQRTWLGERNNLCVNKKWVKRTCLQRFYVYRIYYLSFLLSQTDPIKNIHASCLMDANLPELPEKPGDSGRIMNSPYMCRVVNVRVISNSPNRLAYFVHYLRASDNDGRYSSDLGEFHIIEIANGKIDFNASYSEYNISGHSITFSRESDTKIFITINHGGSAPQPDREYQRKNGKWIFVDEYIRG